MADLQWLCTDQNFPRLQKAKTAGTLLKGDSTSSMRKNTKPYDSKSWDTHRPHTSSSGLLAMSNPRLVTQPVAVRFCYTCLTHSSELGESPPPSPPDVSNCPGTPLVSPLYLLSCDNVRFGRKHYQKHCAPFLSAFVSLGLPLIYQQVCSTVQRWCALHNFQCRYE